MCGISGLINFNGAPVDRQLLKAMTNTLTHRGPDDEGYYISGRPGNGNGKNSGHAGLGHRRLSIIDLSTGHQPMTNENSTVWIVFNGEIYNYPHLKKILEDKGHRFGTNSDTEVIIHGYEEWGEDCVKHLRGMFAFAIWDENQNSMFLARDRLGIKPLYYYADTSKFVFGSEVKAILRHPGVKREIEPKALYGYLCLMYVPAPDSIFKNIHKLLPGHTITVKNGKIARRKYWDIDFSKTEQLSEAQWCEQIVLKLKESTGIRMISDVPLGAFLSGGVDSSAVVAMMSSLQDNPVLTSSIGFGEEKFNELPYAREIAKKYDTDHHETIVTPDAAHILEKLVWHFDEPFGDSSAIPTYYVSKAARKKVTVSLSGDGGDENFAGYRRYYFDRLENRLRSVFPDFFRKNIIGAIARIYPKADWLPRIFRAKTLLTNLSLDPVQGFYNSMSWLQGVKKNILRPDLAESLNEYEPVSVFKEYYNQAQTSDPLSRIQYIDIKTYLVDDILTKVDRASMANSLEVRVPLLDHEFMELAASIPSSLKLNGKKTKYILKKAMEPFLPHNCLYRKKMGFSIPLSMWLKKDLKPVFEDNVFGTNSFISGYLNKREVQSLWKKHLDNLRDYSSELWSILFLEIWGRKWI